MPELIGDDVEFIQQGHIRVAYRPEQVEQLETYAVSARDYGLDLHLISGAAMRKRYPFFGYEVTAASLSPKDDQAYPLPTAPAFTRAATRHGAHIIETWKSKISINRATISR